VYQFFCEKKYPLINLNIIHCNHKIRKQSEQESKFIQEFFKALPVQIFSKPASIKTTEDSLRKRRYQVFAKAMKTSKSEILILGHHLDDRIESTFLNILRGAHLR
jgi:tRNA(Ile)-lysidine synthase TilS/MesJ